MSTKPILFNTDMVRGLLDNRKTATRRVVKPKPLWKKPPVQQKGHPEYWANWDDEKIYKAPYRPGEILYVREKWRIADYLDGMSLKFEYEADGRISDFIDFANDRLQKFLKYISRKKWCPSIFMPREAARIFLRVTDVRVERLREITEEQAKAEGLYKGWTLTERSTPASTARQAFMWVWDGTIKPAVRALYGWGANPWVWVIEFERISREEAMQNV